MAVILTALYKAMLVVGLLQRSSCAGFHANISRLSKSTFFELVETVDWYNAMVVCARRLGAVRVRAPVQPKFINLLL